MFIVNFKIKLHVLQFQKIDNRRYLILGASVHGDVSKRRRAMPERFDVGGFAFVDDGVEAAHGDDVAASRFWMFEEVLEDAGADASLVDVPDVVGVLLGHGNNFVEAFFDHVTPGR